MVIRAIDQQRISRLEGVCEQIDRRLDDMHRAIEGLRSEMNSRFFGELNTRINVLIMLLVAAWVTIMAALITALVALSLN